MPLPRAYCPVPTGPGHWPHRHLPHLTLSVKNDIERESGRDQRDRKGDKGDREGPGRDQGGTREGPGRDQGDR